MTIDANESINTSTELPPSAEIIKRLTILLKHPEFVGRSLALAMSHPEFITKSLTLAISHPGFAAAVREFETKTITAIPGFVPGLVPLPPEVLKVGGEIAASAAACHVGTIIYDRMRRNHKQARQIEEAFSNSKSNPETSKDAIARSFIEEIERMELEAGLSSHK